MRMRLQPRTLVLIAAVALAGSGRDSDSAPVAAAATATPGAATIATTPTADASKTTRTKIVLRSSRFGRMLFNAGDQAIYVFQRDRHGKSVCHGACAKAWPPVYTEGRPRAGSGVRSSLLGTITRRGGRRQVTYAGKPLYYYAHEGPGQVLCHNVFLNGGYWWVVGPDGRRRP
jgi:predicted lipoprotein with Yx(FWY)xxD motif